MQEVKPMDPQELVKWLMALRRAINSPNTVDQSTHLLLTDRFREQARSHSFDCVPGIKNADAK